MPQPEPDPRLPGDPHLDDCCQSNLLVAAYRRSADEPLPLEPADTPKWAVAAWCSECKTVFCTDDCDSPNCQGWPWDQQTDDIRVTLTASTVDLASGESETASQTFLASELESIREEAYEEGDEQNGRTFDVQGEYNSDRREILHDCPECGEPLPATSDYRAGEVDGPYKATNGDGADRPTHREAQCRRCGAEFCDIDECDQHLCDGWPFSTPESRKEYDLNLPNGSDFGPDFQNLNLEAARRALRRATSSIQNTNFGLIEAPENSAVSHATEAAADAQRRKLSRSLNESKETSDPSVGEDTDCPTCGGNEVLEGEATCRHCGQACIPQCPDCQGTYEDGSLRPEFMHPAPNRPGPCPADADAMAQLHKRFDVVPTFIPYSNTDSAREAGRYVVDLDTATVEFHMTLQGRAKDGDDKIWIIEVQLANLNKSHITPMTLNEAIRQAESTVQEHVAEDFGGGDQ